MTKNLFGKVTLTGLSKAKDAAAESVTEHEARLLEVCCQSHNQALDSMKSHEEGLSETAVEVSRETWGSNDLGQKKRNGFLIEILLRCKNPLVIQLLVIAGISLATGDPASATFVSVMVVLSVGLSYYQESKSSKAVEKLNAMVQTNCHVIRGGKEVEIPMSEIVPGDVVSLQAGSIIPADLRLLTAKDFFVSQSSLTGESMPVEKHAEAPPEAIEGGDRNAECRLPGKQCGERSGKGIGCEHRGADPLWIHFGKAPAALRFSPASIGGSPDSPG